MTPHSIGSRTAVQHGAALLLLGLLGATASCTPHDDASLGGVSLDLVGQAPSGAVYRLRHARVTVSGAGTTRTWNTEDALDETSLSDDVPVGSYTASVAPGWALERVEGTLATPVIAELTSDNPASFSVLANQRTIVPLRFHVANEDVELGQGYELVVTADESPAQLIVVTGLDDFGDASIAMFPFGANGDVAPLRRIAGPRTTLVEPAGVTVTRDEIIMCDLSAGAVDVFPLLGNGDIAPTRRISGYDTGIDGCLDVVVVGDELYVSQFSDILVFPVTASGDVPPSRRISGFSSATFLSTDRGELYVADAGADSVLVFPLPVAEGAAPVRTVSTFCPSGVAAGNGELAVGNDCAGRIDMYPADGDGEVSPLRSITRQRDVLEGPLQIARVRGHLYVADPRSEQVLVVPENASGRATPLWSIGGPRTGVIEPFGVAVH